jgi:hypothetical protein
MSVSMEYDCTLVQYYYIILYYIILYYIISFIATNLNGGLLRGIEILNKAQGSHPELSSPASILIMLTDGEPTEGEYFRGCPGRW